MRSLATSAPNTGSFAWVVTGPATAAGARSRDDQRSRIDGCDERDVLDRGAFVDRHQSRGRRLVLRRDVRWRSPGRRTCPRASPVTRRAQSRRRQHVRDAGDERPQHRQLRLDGHRSVDGAGARAGDGRRSRGRWPRRAAAFAIVDAVADRHQPRRRHRVLRGDAAGDHLDDATCPRPSPVTVELSRDGGGSSRAPRRPSAPNTRQLQPGSRRARHTGAALVRVTIGGPGSMAATSGSVRDRRAVVDRDQSGAGAAFYAGTPLAITWSTNLPGASRSSSS